MVAARISRNYTTSFTKFVCVLFVARSSLCGVAMLCTSGFVDDVMFSHNGLYIVHHAYCCVGITPETIHCIDSNQIWINDNDQQVHNRVKCAMHDCVVDVVKVGARRSTGHAVLAECYYLLIS